MILDNWINPAFACQKHQPLIACPTPTVPPSATLEDILALAAAYRQRYTKPVEVVPHTNPPE